MRNELTASVRSWMKDAGAFNTRIEEKAARLWQDAYDVLPTEETGVFLVRREADHQYIVDGIKGTCDCPMYAEFSGKVPCKHLIGLERLIEEKIRWYTKEHDRMKWQEDKLTAARFFEKRIQLIQAVNKMDDHICELQAEIRHEAAEEAIRNAGVHESLLPAGFGY